MPGYANMYQPMQGYPQPQPYPPMHDRMAQIQNNYQNAVAQTTQQPVYSQFQPTMQQQPQMQYMNMPQMLGKFVNEFTDITANDVPMDGRWAIFPKNDLSEIQARAWSSDGKIVPVVFKPVLEEQPSNLPSAEEKLKIGLSDEATEAIMKRFDDITARLDKMEKSSSKQSVSSANKSRKETETE